MCEVLTRNIRQIKCVRKILAFLVALVLLGKLEVTGLNAMDNTNGYYWCILYYCLRSANSLQFP